MQPEKRNSNVRSESVTAVCSVNAEKGLFCPGLKCAQIHNAACKIKHVTVLRTKISSSSMSNGHLLKSAVFKCLVNYF